MSLFGNRSKLPLEMRKPLQSHRHARTPSFIEERQGGVGSCYKRKAHWSKLGVPSVVASHWLSADCLALAGLLPGKEENFLPPAGVVQ